MTEPAETEVKPDPKIEPAIKPEVKPEVKTETTIPDDSIVVTKAELANMQKNLIGLQKESDDATKAKVKAERDGIYNELLVLNPKLAKIHLESSKDVLIGALSAAKEIKTGFQSLRTKKGEEKKASYGDHSSMDYDFVKKEYVFT